MGELFDFFEFFDQTPILDLFTEWKVWTLIIFLAVLTLVFHLYDEVAEIVRPCLGAPQSVGDA